MELRFYSNYGWLCCIALFAQARRKGFAHSASGKQEDFPLIEEDGMEDQGATAVSGRQREELGPLQALRRFDFGSSSLHTAVELELV